MIILRFNGGLGNQLYQYALYSLLKEKYFDKEIKVDITDYIAKSYHQGFEVEKIFKNIYLEKASKREVFEITGRLPVFYGGPGKEKVVKIRRRINRLFFNKWNGNVTWGSDLKEVILDEERLDEIFVREHVYIDRFFANPVTLNNVERVAKELSFVPIMDDNNINVLQQIETSNSVSVHVRRGDYVGTAFDVVSDSYYEKAIEYVQKNVENPFFYIFSDDKAYVERMFADIKNKKIVTHNKGKESFRDMQLMSKCKHNIVANSTFSQWGALLNNNSDKLVIYPVTPEMYENGERYLLKGWRGINFIF